MSRINLPTGSEPYVVIGDQVVSEYSGVRLIEIGMVIPSPDGYWRYCDRKSCTSRQ